MVKFLFDLDGTLTKRETLPLLAEHFRVRAEIERLTRETVEGKLSFEESFRYRVKLLGNLPVNEVADFLGQAEIHPGMAGFIRRHREDCCIVTSNLSCWIRHLAQRIGCKCYSSEAVVRDNRIQELSYVLCKEKIVQDWQKQGYRVIFIGDGSNDAGAMQKADFAIAVAFAHTPAAKVLAAADEVFVEDEKLCDRLEELAVTK